VTFIGTALEYNFIFEHVAPRLCFEIWLKMTGKGEKAVMHEKSKACVTTFTKELGSKLSDTKKKWPILL